MQRSLSNPLNLLSERPTRPTLLLTTTKASRNATSNHSTPRPHRVQPTSPLTPHHHPRSPSRPVNSHLPCRLHAPKAEPPSDLLRLRAKVKPRARTVCRNMRASLGDPEGRPPRAIRRTWPSCRPSCWALQAMIWRPSLGLGKARLHLHVSPLRPPRWAGLVRRGWVGSGAHRPRPPRLAVVHLHQLLDRITRNKRLPNSPGVRHRRSNLSANQSPSPFSPMWVTPCSKFPRRQWRRPKNGLGPTRRRRIKGARVAPHSVKTIRKMPRRSSPYRCKCSKNKLTHRPKLPNNPRRLALAYNQQPSL
ncbi:hypothetical protein BCR44DRAFT_1246969 [Catenaria anguillulae PL171]|uniref:Uncharacterized protein n=1 Tax=Catenaria anguillulae PL171 TaxID=765915 RepID=A0A1Y2HXP3_9FUNG|nr:hypothetical protein BCR44DRAFT_1246969 [Catenaria anguillulae PL171]